ncbi:hypothetical protein [uncultured Shimia sp.]|uniref:hypothetical protein n=1 Tax=uncultured Shimia sp. TaxID=573152 RepID=UPI00262EDCDE|nr:hypothetical protein [uncultured Shimia sp.]
MKSVQTSQILVVVARLFLIAILLERLWPYFYLATVSNSLEGYLALVDRQGAHFAVLTMIVLLVILRWSKTIVATVSAMFAIAGLHDAIVYGIDLSKSYQLNDLFWGTCFAVAAVLLSIAIYLEKRTNASAQENC